MSLSLGVLCTSPSSASSGNEEAVLPADGLKRGALLLAPGGVAFLIIRSSPSSVSKGNEEAGLPADGLEGAVTPKIRPWLLAGSRTAASWRSFGCFATMVVGFCGWHISKRSASRRSFGCVTAMVVGFCGWHILKRSAGTGTMRVCQAKTRSGRARCGTPNARSAVFARAGGA